MTLEMALAGWAGTVDRTHTERARALAADAFAAFTRTGDVFDQALAAFAERYADQNERDYRAMQEAVESGRLTAVTGL